MHGLTFRVTSDRHGFANLYTQIKNNKNIDLSQISTPAKPKLTSSLFEDIFLPNGTHLGYLKIGLMLFFFNVAAAVPMIIAAYHREARIKVSESIAAEIQALHVHNPNGTATDKNDAVNWLYNLSVDELAQLERLYNAIANNQDTIMASVQRRNRETETVLLSKLPGETSLVVKSGSICLKRGDEYAEIMSFADFLTIHTQIVLKGTKQDRLDLGDLDLRGVDLSNRELKYVYLIGSKLQGAKLNSMVIDHVNFDGADITNISLQNSQVTNSRMNTIGTGYKFDQTDFKDTPLTLTFPDWDEATLDQHITELTNKNNLLVAINKIKDKAQKIAMMQKLLVSIKDIDTSGPNMALLNFFKANTVYAEDPTIKTFIDRLKQRPSTPLKYTPRDNSTTDTTTRSTSSTNSSTNTLVDLSTNSSTSTTLGSTINSTNIVLSPTSTLVDLSTSPSSSTLEDLNTATPVGLNTTPNIGTPTNLSTSTLDDLSATSSTSTTNDSTSNLTNTLVGATPSPSTSAVVKNTSSTSTPADLKNPSTDPIPDTARSNDTASHSEDE